MTTNRLRGFFCRPLYPGDALNPYAIFDLAPRPPPGPVRSFCSGVCTYADRKYLFISREELQRRGRFVQAVRFHFTDLLTQLAAKPAEVNHLLPDAWAQRHRNAAT